MGKKLLSAIIVIFLLGFLFFQILNNWEAVSSFNWRWKFGNLFLLFVFVLPMYFLNVLSWHLITRALGIRVSLLSNMRIWLLSNLSRFLPGSFWQYPGRVYLLKKEGVNLHLAAASLIVEVLLNLLITSLVVVVTFAFGSLSWNKQWVTFIILFGTLLLFCLFALSNTKVMTFLGNLINKKTGKGEIISQIKLPLTQVPLIAFIFFLQNIFSGGALFFVSKSAVDLPLSAFPSFVGIFSISWLLGYITVFAPSGLGVQEASIAALLSQYMPFPVAAVVAILFRLVLLLSEFLNILIMLFVFRPSNKGQLKH